MAVAAAVVVVEKAFVVVVAVAGAVQRLIVAVGVAAEIRQNLYSVDCQKWRLDESDFEMECW